MTAVYPTYELALRRVETLRTHGIWPGITGPDTNGCYRLTYDPESTWTA